MIAHKNVIANVMQFQTFEAPHREKLKAPGELSDFNDITLGLLPQSHIYAMVVVCHAGPFRGDQAIILPKFDLKYYLEAIQNFKISSLFLVCFDFKRAESETKIIFKDNAQLNLTGE